MYYKDMTEIANWPGKEKAYHVGWLDISEPFTKGELPVGFSEKLLSVLENFNGPVSGGFHLCPFCPGLTRPKAGYKKEMNLGSFDFQIFSEDSTKMFYTPNMIIHYTEAHGYKPPQEFIDAVMAYNPPR